MYRSISRTPPPRWGDTYTDLLLIAGAVVAGFAGLLWCGAALAAIASGSGLPSGGPLRALTALTHAADPAAAWPHPDVIPGPMLYWSATGVVLLLAGGACWAALLLLRRTRTGPLPAARIRTLPGLASPAEAAYAAGTRPTRARAELVRPSLTGADVDVEQVAYRIGAAGGRDLYASVEDSILLVGPPRMGKGLHLVIPWILDAPGPVVTTSTRPDTIAITYQARARTGAVAVFDPQRLAGLPDGLAWSPVRGCEHPRTALVRARGLAAGVGYGAGVSDAGFWQGQTETALRCLLHAAALDGRTAADLYRWSINPALAEDAVTTLVRASTAAEGWADALDAIVHTDPRTRDSIWLGVRQALAALADPDVLAAVQPSQPDQEFHPEQFLTGSNTLYLLASAVASGSCGPLIAALVEDITETARTRAARSAGARLDPPLLLALDEIANLTPLPSLPSLMAEGGGSGITTLAVLQSLAQARHRWGEHAADTLWDAATVKIALGGLAKLRDLDDIARLLGEYDEPTLSQSRGRAGERSTTTAVRQVPVMPPALLRTLPFGTAILLLRQARPVVVDLRPWTRRRDTRQLILDQAHTQAVIAGDRRQGGASS
jgi:type IV secretory pathway TraG/TraD family ATPase VirD4